MSVGLTTVTSMLPMLGLAMGFERGTGPTLLSGAEFVLRAGGSARAIGAIAGIHLRLGARTQPAAK